MSTIIQLRRGTQAEADSVIGYEGELFLDLDGRNLRYHDGSTQGGLVIGRYADTISGYGITDAYTQTQVNSLLSVKADVGTTIADYGIQDAYTKTEVDGLIGAETSFIESSGQITRIDALDTEIQLTGNIIPTADSTYSLGDSTHQFKDLWLSGNTLYVGGEVIETSGGRLVLNGDYIPTEPEVDVIVQNKLPSIFTGYKPSAINYHGNTAPFSDVITGNEVLIDQATWLNSQAPDPSFTPSVYSYTLDGNNQIVDIQIVQANDYGDQGEMWAGVNTDNMNLIDAGIDITDPAAIQNTSFFEAIGAGITSTIGTPTTASGYNITDVYTQTDVDNALAGKADAATTLAGYGITDAYTQAEIAALIQPTVKTAPVSSVGTAGDVYSDVAVDGTYFYFCTADYDGSTDVWKRIAWDNTSW